MSDHFKGYFSVQLGLNEAGTIKCSLKLIYQNTEQSIYIQSNGVMSEIIKKGAVKKRRLILKMGSANEVILLNDKLE